LLARALELNHSAGDIRTKAVCSVNLGVAYQNMERLQASGDAYERALGFYREISDKRGEGVALNGLGDVLSLRGDHGRAAECYKRSRAAFREAGDRYGEAAVQLDYSRALLRSGETELAIENSRRAVSLNREAGHRHAEAMSLNVLGQALAATGSWDDARDAQRCRAEASAIFLLIGDHDAAAACGN
jgi:tetratricopeptide (TPR) repeat protein